jgi:uncharacterized protein (DUF2267 family)
MHDNNNVSYADQSAIIKTLKDAVKNGEDAKIRTQHVKNVRNMLGENF